MIDIIHSANIMMIDPQQDPPQKKDSARNKCFGPRVASTRTTSVHLPSALWRANKF